MLVNCRGIHVVVRYLILRSTFKMASPNAKSMVDALFLSQSALFCENDISLNVV